MSETETKAPSQNQFCNILADARRYKLKGHWQGSTHGCHPCGVFREGIIFTNHWHTADLCSAEVVLDPTSPMAEISSDPRSYGGNPYLRPERGGTLQVYYTGRWLEEDGPWRQKILKVLSDLEAEIIHKRREEEGQREAENQKKQREHAQKLEAARAALT
jgi:hypothetical protein